MVLEPVARPPLGALPSVASAQCGTCTIFEMSTLADRMDSQVRAASALPAPGRDRSSAADWADGWPST
jgi:hypothetical protein